MAWTASLQSVSKLNGVVVLTVIYSDGKKESFIEEYRFTSKPSPTYLADITATRIQAIQDTYTFADGLTIGEITPTEAKELTQLDLDRQAYNVLVMKLSMIKGQVNVGAVASDAKVVTDLEVATKAAFRPEFV